MTKHISLFALIHLGLVAAAVPAATPAAPNASGEDRHFAGSELEAYREAVDLEQGRQLTRAEQLYRELIARSAGDAAWRTRLDAEQGLARIEDMRGLFSLSQAELQAALAKTYRDWQPAELAEFERRGWINSWTIDGRKLYASSNTTNLQFFETALMA